MISAPELADDPRYSDGEARSENRESLNKTLEAITVQKTSQEWITSLNDAGVPCGPIYGVDETFNDPQVQHLGIARKMIHDDLGSLEVVGQAVNLWRQPQPSTMRLPTPGKGQHTDEVLGDMGIESEEIKVLRTEGIV